MIEKKRLRGRVARMRRPEAIVSKRAQKPGPPSSAAENHGISSFLLNDKLTFFPIPFFSITHHHHYGVPILCRSKHKMGRALTGNSTPSTSSFFLTFSLFLHFNMESTQNHIFTPKVFLTGSTFYIISHEQMFS